MPEPTPLLGPTQRKIAGAAIGLFALLAILVLLAGIVWGLARVIGFFSSVLWPLAAAGILALILRPFVDVLQNRFKLRRLWAVILLYSAFVLTVTGAVLAVAPVVVSQAIEFAHAVPGLWAKASAYVQTHYPEWIAYSREKMQEPTVKSFVDGLTAEGGDLLSTLVPSLKTAIGKVANVVGFAVGLAVVPVYLFFFLLSRSDAFARLGELLPFVREDIRDDVVFLVREFVGIVVAFFRGQLLIGLIMGVCYAVGFSVGGLKAGFVIGLAMGLLNIVPYLGTILGLSVAIPLAFFQPDGDVQQVAIVLAVFAAVQALEGWFLTPRIMGSRTGLHPVAIIFSVLFWGTALDGVLGMILAIPLSAFFVTAWRLAKRKYLTAPAAKPAADAA